MLQYSSVVCYKRTLAERDGYLDEEGNLITLYFVSRLIIAVISTSAMFLFFPWEGRGGKIYSLKHETRILKSFIS
jgi:hypothetical protein